MVRIIKNARGEKKGEKKVHDFRIKLGFKLHDITMNKVKSATAIKVKAFSNGSLLPQYSVLSYQINLFFPKHKLAIEIDEKGHIDIDEKNR